MAQLGWMDDRQEGLFACHRIEVAGFFGDRKKRSGADETGV